MVCGVIIPCLIGIGRTIDVDRRGTPAEHHQWVTYLLLRLPGACMALHAVYAAPSSWIVCMAAGAASCYDSMCAICHNRPKSSFNRSNVCFACCLCPLQAHLSHWSWLIVTHPYLPTQ